MQKVETKLKLHLWTKEERRGKAIIVCLNNVFKEITDNVNISTTDYLAKMALKNTKDKAFKNIADLDTVNFDIRTPSLSYIEIPRFIEQIISIENSAVHNYICLDNNFYKYIDIHFKHLLENGAIQIYIDGIHHTEITSTYNINLALMIAINATDNSLKFRNAIANK